MLDPAEPHHPAWQLVSTVVAFHVPARGPSPVSVTPRLSAVPIADVKEVELRATIDDASAAGGAAGVRKAVVEDGADANAAVFNRNGTMGGTRTAVYVAAERGLCGVLGVLLAAPVSADPDKGNTRNGWTPCYAACFRGFPDAVAMLLAHGADPNIAAKGGWTSCMNAALIGNTACLRALAEGAARQEGRTLDVNAMNMVGMTALDFALVAVVLCGPALAPRAPLERRRHRASACRGPCFWAGARSPWTAPTLPRAGGTARAPRRQR